MSVPPTSVQIRIAVHIYKFQRVRAVTEWGRQEQRMLLRLKTSAVQWYEGKAY